MMLLVVPTVPHHHEEGLVCVELHEHDHETKSNDTSSDNNCAADTKFVSRTLELDFSDNARASVGLPQILFYPDFYDDLFLLHNHLVSNAYKLVAFSELKLPLCGETGLGQLGFRAPPALFS
jgi:hypothetical protein